MLVNWRIGGLLIPPSFARKQILSRNTEVVCLMAEFGGISGSAIRQAASTPLKPSSISGMDRNLRSTLFRNIVGRNRLVHIYQYCMKIFHHSFLVSVSDNASNMNWFLAYRHSTRHARIFFILPKLHRLPSKYYDRRYQLYIYSCVHDLQV